MKNRYSNMLDIVIEEIIRKKYYIISFMIVLIILVLSGLSHKEMAYYYDSRVYFENADKFIESGQFHFLNYPDTFRGYILSFMVLLFNTLSDFLHIERISGYIVYNSVMLTTLIVCIMPYLLKVKDGKRMIVGSVIFAAIFIYFWPDMIYFCLSDMWALFFFACGIFIMTKLEEYRKLELKISRKNIVLYFLLGFCFYVAYNIRTVYDIPVIITFLVFGFRYLRSNNLKIVNLITIILVLFIGYIVPGIPQHIINNNILENPSIRVIANVPGGKSLTLQQLFWGIQYPRYETSLEHHIGAIMTYPSAGVKFVDKNGIKLLNEIGEDQSYLSLIGAYFKHPIEYTKIYLRHGFNGLNPIFRESYITKLDRSKMVAFNLNYFIIFIAGIVYIKRFKELFQERFWLYAFMFTALISVPGAVEVRFMLPAFIVIYGLICFRFKWSMLLEIFKNRKVLLATTILFVALYSYNYRVIDSTLKSTEYNVPIYLNGSEE